MKEIVEFLPESKDEIKEYLKDKVVWDVINGLDGADEVYQKQIIEELIEESKNEKDKKNIIQKIKSWI